MRSFTTCGLCRKGKGYIPFNLTISTFTLFIPPKILYTSNSLKDEKYFARIKVWVFVSEESVAAVPAFRGHRDAPLHVVGLQMRQGELVRQLLHVMDVQRSDSVPVTVYETKTLLQNLLYLEQPGTTAKLSLTFSSQSWSAFRVSGTLP